MKKIWLIIIIILVLIIPTIQSGTKTNGQLCNLDSECIFGSYCDKTNLVCASCICSAYIASDNNPIPTKKTGIDILSNQLYKVKQNTGVYLRAGIKCDPANTYNFGLYENDVTEGGTDDAIGSYLATAGSKEYYTNWITTFSNLKEAYDISKQEFYFTVLANARGQIPKQICTSIPIVNDQNLLHLCKTVINTCTGIEYLDCDGNSVPDGNCGTYDRIDMGCDGIYDCCRNDADCDTILDINDNCVSVSNTDQIDSDGDGKGNACDNCVYTINPEQEATRNYKDKNGNVVGNACWRSLDTGQKCSVEENCKTGFCLGNTCTTYNDYCTINICQTNILSHLKFENNLNDYYGKHNGKLFIGQEKYETGAVGDYSLLFDTKSILYLQNLDLKYYPHFSIELLVKPKITSNILSLESDSGSIINLVDVIPDPNEKWIYVWADINLQINEIKYQINNQPQQTIRTELTVGNPPILRIGAGNDYNKWFIGSIDNLKIYAVSTNSNYQSYCPEGRCPGTQKTNGLCTENVECQKNLLCKNTLLDDVYKKCVNGQCNLYQDCGETGKCFSGEIVNNNRAGFCLLCENYINEYANPIGSTADCRYCTQENDYYCGPLEICKNNICQKVLACNDNSECQNEDTCVNGKCIPKNNIGEYCENDIECIQGLKCIKLICNKQCNYKEDCSSININSKCISKETGISTDYFEGSCKKCYGSECLSCLNYPNPNSNFVETHDCGALETCVNSNCVRKCTTNADCLNGQTCQNNICQQTQTTGSGSGGGGGSGGSAFGGTISDCGSYVYCLSPKTCIGLKLNNYCCNGNCLESYVTATGTSLITSRGECKVEIGQTTGKREVKICESNSADNRQDCNNFITDLNKLSELGLTSGKYQEECTILPKDVQTNIPFFNFISLLYSIGLIISYYVIKR